MRRDSECCKTRRTPNTTNQHVVDLHMSSTAVVNDGMMPVQDHGLHKKKTNLQRRSHPNGGNGVRIQNAKNDLVIGTNTLGRRELPLRRHRVPRHTVLGMTSRVKGGVGVRL